MEDVKLLAQYTERRKQYLSGEVSDKDWIAYCEKILDILCEKNKKVLDNLKNM